MEGTVVSVSRGAAHRFSKQRCGSIEIVAGMGVAGDAHAGALVKHRYLVRKNPNARNLCQVHLLPVELFDELRAKGFDIAPGDLGENVTTAGGDLLALPLGAKLHLGARAVVEVTGLRTPCGQMNKFHPGLMVACLDRAADGSVVRRAGIMAIALTGGLVAPDDPIAVELPPAPWVSLGPV